MAKQKQDNKTVDIELLILRDKVECLIDEYVSAQDTCRDNGELNAVDAFWFRMIIKDLKNLLEN